MLWFQSIALISESLGGPRSNSISIKSSASCPNKNVSQKRVSKTDVKYVLTIYYREHNSNPYVKSGSTFTYSFYAYLDVEEILSNDLHLHMI